MVLVYSRWKVRSAGGKSLLEDDDESELELLGGGMNEELLEGGGEAELLEGGGDEYELLGGE